MKLLSTILLATTLTSYVMAQTVLNGLVMDVSGKRLPFASVALLKTPDSSFIKGTLTSEQGQYRFDQVKPGQYRISVTMVGFQPTKSAVITVADSPVVVPALVLNETSQQLKEVAVSAQKPFFEQQIEGYRQATQFTQEGNTRRQHQLVGRLTHSQTFTFPTSLRLSYRVFIRAAP